MRNKQIADERKSAVTGVSGRGPTRLEHFCRHHWRTWSVFDDDGWYDSIRGTCPNGPERELEG